MLSMRNLHKVLLYMCLIGTANCVFGQTAPNEIVYTASFTKKIEKAHIDIYEPVESWLHVYPLDKDEYMHYDLVLQNDRNDFEVRYRIRPEKGRWKNVPQNMEVQRIITSIATNDPDANIRILKPEPSFFMETFNASDGIIAYFVPKLTYSEKRYGALISLEDPGNAAIDVIILYNDDGYDAYQSFRHLRFQ